MLETSQPSTSKAARFNNSTSNVAHTDIEMEEVEDNQESSSLWCVEDDTMFYAQGLKHHSAGKGNKTGRTTLTKVRISLPVHEQQLEEIANMLILEMNTLIYMKSGRVYYFSSVKSMHKVDWLTGVRCMTSCPLTQFSVIRMVNHEKREEVSQQRLLSLEVYKDVPQLGKCTSDDHILRHSYDISFDLENIFNCDWLQETYTLTSMITDEKNISFLKQLVSMGNIFRAKEDVIELEMNQEVHIFTISGNIFILAGAIISESESTTTNPEVEDYSIRLLNTYACHIECLRIDCENNLLIVLLQSGHMDIWYKSNRMFGAIFHQQHQISQFLNYDYWPSENMFYFTTLDDVIQLKIITSNEISNDKECTLKETRKSIGGMIACTWVDSLKQLICLSFNNIFYRINFTTLNESLEYTHENETKYENFTSLYALSLKRIKDLTAKAQIVNVLMEQPNELHNGIEKEFQKQQLLALAPKSEIFKKLFQCHLEYHVNIPGTEYYDKDCVQIKTINPHNHRFGTQSIYCLIFMSLKNNHNFLSSVFTTSMWYLYITTTEQCLQLHIPYEIINNKLCFIVDIPLKEHTNQSLPVYSLHLLSFLNHHYQHMCLRFKLSLETNEKTYLNIFSHNIRNLPIYRNFLNDIESLIKEHSNATDQSNAAVEEYKLKHHYKISKNILENIMEKLKAKSFWACSGGMDFVIYYLHQYLIVLNYDSAKEILRISSNYPVAIFYIKILLHAEQSCNDLNIIDTSDKSLKQMIMNYQSDIEQLYGSLISLDSEEVNTNTISMHLENMKKVFFKLRNEFYDMFR